MAEAIGPDVSRVGGSAAASPGGSSKSGSSHHNFWTKDRELDLLQQYIKLGIVDAEHGHVGDQWDTLQNFMNGKGWKGKPGALISKLTRMTKNRLARLAKSDTRISDLSVSSHDKFSDDVNTLLDVIIVTQEQSRQSKKRRKKVKREHNGGDGGDLLGKRSRSDLSDDEPDPMDRMPNHHMMLMPQDYAEGPALGVPGSVVMSGPISGGVGGRDHDIRSIGNGNSSSSSSSSSSGGASSSSSSSRGVKKQKLLSQRDIPVAAHHVIAESQRIHSVVTANLEALEAVLEGSQAHLPASSMRQVQILRQFNQILAANLRCNQLLCNVQGLLLEEVRSQLDDNAAAVGPRVAAAVNDPVNASNVAAISSVVAAAAASQNP